MSTIAEKPRSQSLPFVDLPETAPPAERLLATPQQFDFFQAVRLLEAMQPARRPVGSYASPKDEIVRFRAALGTAFPPSSIADLRETRDAGENPAPPEMTIAFLGLTGPSGVLPAHYTELLGRIHRDFRTPEKQAVAAWFDLFNHRFTSLFYRAWEKYRPFVPYQRGEYRDASPDTFTQALLSFSGIGRQHKGVPVDPRFPSAAYQLPRALVRYAGLFAQQPHNVANLLAILQDYFALPVEVLQFQGQWMTLAEDQQTRLGSCGTLGIDSIVGPRVFDRKGKIRIRIGPLSLVQFEQLLPNAPCKDRDAPHLAEVTCVVRCYLGPELDFDVQLVLRGDEIPACRLGEEGGPARLGWNTWLPSENATAPRQDATFDPEELAQSD